MAEKPPSDIPDLVIPPPRTRSHAPAPPAEAPKIELPSDDDDEMQIDRGGAMVTLDTAVSPRSVAPRHLELGASPANHPERRHAPPPRLARGPSAGEKVLAWALPLVLAIATTASLLKFVHRSGRGLHVFLPHAFDATSVPQSGAVAGFALVLAIAVGYMGFRLEPRSHVLVGAAVPLVIASIAMITVALVATEEHPAPPDGALLIPYAVPLALALIGVAIFLRAPARFLEFERVRAVAFGVVAGALLFAAFELSAFAR